MGDSDSEIEFNLNENAHEDLQEEVANENQNGQGQGDARRFSDRTSRSPVRRPRNTREMRDASEERWQPPYRDSHRNHDLFRSSVIITPDTYTGDDDWEQYISHFEDCAELGNWTEKEKVLTLAAKLKGQARVFYTSLPIRDKRSYRSLLARLEQRFGSARQQSRWISRLQARVRRPGESIAALGDDLLLMAQKAYISLDANAQEMLALQQFYKAVSLEMRCRIMDKDCTSISEAVDVVERYEELLNDCPDKKRTVARGADRRPVHGNNQNIGSAENQPHYNKNSDHGSSYGDYLHNNGFRRNNQSADSTLSQTGGLDNADNETVSISTALRDLVERIDRLERGRNQPTQSKQLGQRQNKTCYICNSPYHFFRKCPKYRAVQASAYSQAQSGRSENGKQPLL